MPLVCHNDGKGRLQSFTVWDTDHDLNAVDAGYGATAAEAYYDYMVKAAEYLKRVRVRVIDIAKAEKMEAADYAGRIIPGKPPYEM